jgi:hypothetical protein
MIEFTEDRIPVAGIEETIAELVDLYGGTMRERRAGSPTHPDDEGDNEAGQRTRPRFAREFTLPLRRGIATAGAVECTISWAVGDAEEATVTLRGDRDVDAPKAQRVAMLVAGVIGSLMFLMWPFTYGTQYGTLAWIGGAVAFAVYLLTLRKTSGGIAADFLQRLARRQRASSGFTTET